MNHILGTFCPNNFTSLLIAPISALALRGSFFEQTALKYEFHEALEGEVI